MSEVGITKFKALYLLLDLLEVDVEHHAGCGVWEHPDRMSASEGEGVMEKQ